MNDEIKTSDIVVEGNPRKDFSELDELTASIREKGVLEPLWITKNKVLVAGERRLRAAKALGLPRVPVRVVDANKEDELSELRLVENMQRKDLNPIEEAEAFDDYIQQTKHGIEHLAKKLGKKPDYVARRLLLLKVSEPVRKALVERKIELGHAAILSRLEPKAQKSKIREVLRNHMTVQDLAGSFEYRDVFVDLNNAPFDKKQCEGCNFNGGSQAMLTDAGAVLKGNCMKKSCFAGKVNAWKQSETEVLREKGINVIGMKKAEELNAREIQTWDEDYKRIVNSLHKKPDVYAVVLDVHRLNPKKRVFQIKKEEKPRKELSTKEREEAEKRLNLSRQEKLQSRIDEFRGNFLIQTSTKLAKPGSRQVKALVLWDLLSQYGSSDAVDNVAGMFGHKSRIPAGYDATFAKKMFAGNGGKLDKAIKIMVEDILQGLDGKQLEIASEAFGVNLEKHFELSKEFLELHTKEQLTSLAKEMRINVAGLVKRTDLVDAFLTPESKKETKGRVPKTLRASKSRA